MKEYTKNRESQSRTVESNSNGFRQPPVSEILQAYRNGTLGRSPIQRESIEEDDDLTSGQSPVSTILQQYSEKRQRYASEEDEEILQGKFEAIQRQEKPNNTGLPDNLKSGIENLSGYSMDDVKVHYNSDKPTQLNALAYTQGTDIHVAPGQEQHLPHEAWHVVQQKQGRVQPTTQMQGVDVNDNSGLEREADMMGGKVREAGVTSEHTNDCGCNLCRGAKGFIYSKQKIGNLNNKFYTIQKCPKCMDPSCKMGEKCKIGDDLDGLLPPGTTGVDPVKFYDQKLGHGGRSEEWEHPLANAPMKIAGLSHLYHQSPVIGMPKEVHRSAMDGMGGGVTSTGYSTIARGWADYVAETISTEGVVAGIKKGLVDDVNAYAAQGKLTEGHKSTFVQVVRGYVEKKTITQAQGDTLASEIYSHIEDMLRWGSHK